MLPNVWNNGLQLIFQVHEDSIRGSSFDGLYPGAIVCLCFNKHLLSLQGWTRPCWKIKTVIPSPSSLQWLLVLNDPQITDQSRHGRRRAILRCQAHLFQNRWAWKDWSDLIGRVPETQKKEVQEVIMNHISYLYFPSISSAKFLEISLFIASSTVSILYPEDLAISSMVLFSFSLLRMRTIFA